MPEVSRDPLFIQFDRQESLGFYEPSDKKEILTNICLAPLRHAWGFLRLETNGFQWGGKYTVIEHSAITIIFWSIITTICFIPTIIGLSIHFYSRINYGMPTSSHARTYRLITEPQDSLIPRDKIIKNITNFPKFFEGIANARDIGISYTSELHAIGKSGTPKFNSEAFFNFLANCTDMLTLADIFHGFTLNKKAASQKFASVWDRDSTMDNYSTKRRKMLLEKAKEYRFPFYDCLPSTSRAKFLRSIIDQGLGDCVEPFLNMLLDTTQYLEKLFRHILDLDQNNEYPIVLSALEEDPKKTRKLFSKFWESFIKINPDFTQKKSKLLLAAANSNISFYLEASTCKNSFPQDVLNTVKQNISLLTAEQILAIHGFYEEAREECLAFDEQVGINILEIYQTKLS